MGSVIWDCAARSYFVRWNEGTRAGFAFSGAGGWSWDEWGYIRGGMKGSEMGRGVGPGGLNNCVSYKGVEKMVKESGEIIWMGFCMYP